MAAKQQAKIPSVAQPMMKPVNAPDAMGVTKADMTAGSSTLTPREAVGRLGGPQVQKVSETESLVNAAAVYLYRQARFQPIAQLNPESLSWQLSEWNVGTMRRFSLTMDAIENRDAVIKSVTGKLKHALSRRSFEIVKVEGKDVDQAEADKHAEVLSHFYNNIECTNAIDRNVRGGFSTLVEQMMDAALKKYACHEIVWKPQVDGSLHATFVFVPLWFFENRTGSLRFCGNFAWDGIPLKDGNWCITVGDGIMEAISVAWMYKTISMRDWLIYSEKHGMPGIVGKTPFSAGSAGFNAIEEAVRAVSTDFSAVIGMQDTIEAVQFGQQGQLPYPPLVEYMDKAISALARGADLSTLSSSSSASGTGQGASLQGDESDLIEQHYGQIISETLNHYVDPYVLKWHFGDDVVPKAYAKLNVPKRKDVTSELAVDNALVAMGVSLSKADACERYARNEATDEQIAEGDVLAAPAVAPNPMAGQPGAEGGNLAAGGTSGMALSAERKNWLKSFRGGQQGGAPTHPSHPIAQKIKAFREGQQGAEDGQGEWQDTSSSDNLTPAQRLMAYRQSKAQLGNAAKTLNQEASNELKPFINRLEKILEMPNDEHYVAALKSLRHELPKVAASATRTVQNAQGLLSVHEVINHPLFHYEN